MSKPKPTLDAWELNPNFFYRKHSPIALGVIGLSASQIDEKIKTGELPPLVKTSASGRGVGWTGSQLIELQRQRLAEAEERARRKQNA
jgi:predicted DNA-binding transcriptional regulator AlpA